jgi:hypothetical protein
MKLVAVIVGVVAYLVVCSFIGKFLKRFSESYPPINDQSENPVIYNLTTPSDTIPTLNDGIYADGNQSIRSTARP